MTDEEEITEEERLIGHKLAGTEGWKCVSVAGDNRVYRPGKSD